MTDEIRKKAIEKSRELYPEETGIFERWEKRIEIYNAGFWSIPYNFNEIIEFWNTEDPFTRDQRRKTLYSCTALLNDLLTYGHCKAAVKKCVKQYIKWGERFHLLENLRQFNKLIKSNLGNAYIREHFLSSVSSEINPLFEMFLKSIPDKNEKSEESD